VLNDSAPPGREAKYARPERERRFLLSAPPDGQVARAVRITDRYLTGTRLRLRRSVELAGDQDGAGHVVFKLTQKVPGPAGEPGLTTTLYLNAAEYGVLMQLPGVSLRKVRLSIPPLGVDVFEGALAGLVLAEAEFDDDVSLLAFTPPADAVAEVTRDQRLSGGSLAVTTAPELDAVLASYGVTR
jgi:CYTH domain-containing protein